MANNKNANLSSVEYLEQMLRWDAFVKAHRKVYLSLRETLDELYKLREQVAKK